MISKYDENRTFFAIVAIFQKDGFFETILDFEVKFTPWRWRQSKNIMAHDATMIFQ